MNFLGISSHNHTFGVAFLLTFKPAFPHERQGRDPVRATRTGFNFMCVEAHKTSLKSTLFCFVMFVTAVCFFVLTQVVMVEE